MPELQEMIGQMKDKIANRLKPKRKNLPTTGNFITTGNLPTTGNLIKTVNRNYTLLYIPN